MEIPSSRITEPLSAIGSAKGSYVLLIGLPAGRELTVGRLGRYKLPKGNYLYFGSALNGLKGRLLRHINPDKKIHWHVDNLTAFAPVKEIWWQEGADRLECVWSEVAALHPGSFIPIQGFGSSDCRCPTHLFRFSALADVRSLKKELKFSRSRVIRKPSLHLSRSG